MKATALKALCSAAYQQALRETRRELGGCLRSRGRYFYALDASGNPPSRYEAESCPWDGTQRQLNSEIKFAKEMGYTNLVVQGGLDYADSVRDFEDGTYDPLVAEWYVDVEMN